MPNKRVCSDLKAILRIPDCEVFESSVNRANLFYEASRLPLPSAPELPVRAGLNGLLHSACADSSEQQSCTHSGCSRPREGVPQVRWKPADVIGDMMAWMEEHFESNESGIVYCLTRKDAETVSQLLNVAGMSAGFYHADMDPSIRQSVHQSWSKSET